MTLTLVTALLILLGVSGTAWFVCVRAALVKQYDAALLTKAQALALQLHISERGKVEFDFSDNAMPEFSPSRSAEYFQLSSVSGSSVERSSSLGKSDLHLPAQNGEKPSFSNVTLPDGRAGRGVVLHVHPIAEDEQSSAPSSGPTFVLAVAKERSSLDSSLTTIGVAGAGGIGVLALAFAAMIPWLVGRNLRSLNLIAAQAGQIDAGALQTRFPVDFMPAELQPICTRLNHSLEGLQKAFERERRFSADVAHELRTPIAELRLLTDVALRFSKEREDAERSFRDTQDIAKHMEAIVESLLLMITPDSESDKQQNWQPTDLEQVFRRAWRANETAVAAKNLSFEWAPRSNGAVHTHATLFGQIVSNLMSNAIEYSPHDAAVVARQDVVGDRTSVTISNPTDLLQEADLTHITEPFWRKDGSRTGAKHVGLGLSLVECYARRINVELQYKMPSPGIFQACVTFQKKSLQPAG
jgi:two-component system sensor histidine kinase QseC